MTLDPPVCVSKVLPPSPLYSRGASVSFLPEWDLRGMGSKDAGCTSLL